MQWLCLACLSLCLTEQEPWMLTAWPPTEPSSTKPWTLMSSFRPSLRHRITLQSTPVPPRWTARGEIHQNPSASPQKWPFLLIQVRNIQFTLTAENQENRKSIFSTTSTIAGIIFNSMAERIVESFSLNTVNVHSGLFLGVCFYGSFSLLAPPEMSS